MDTPTWRSDAHGTYSLQPATADGGHVWIQGRRPYCDRGHWEWGTLGVNVDRRHHPEPSYYFMRLDNALAEVEEWLRRLQRPGTSPALCPGSFTHGASPELDGRWEETDTGLVAHVPGTEVRLTLTPVATPSGPTFRLDATGVPHLDEADRFPRRYFCAPLAQQEAEEFLAWRLLQRPAEVPGPIERPDRPLGGRAPGRPARARP